MPTKETPKETKQDLPKETLDYIKQLEEENQELKDELVELRKFAQFVRGLKTHEDFNKLRNVILATNKKLG